MMLRDRIAVVTGASRGIGRAIAVALAREGAGVVVNYLQDEAGAETTAQLVRDAGAAGLVCQGDVRRLDAVADMCRATLDAFGQVDILVNNAGIIRDNLLTFMSDEEWDDVLDTSLKGTFHGIKVFGREMARRRSGAIVNIASDAGLLGDMLRANYASAKSGLLGLTRTAAREFAASGVRVNAISPGIVETDLTAAMAEPKKQAFLARIPQGRLGRPEEVADAVAWLATRASYVNGSVIHVNGGLFGG
jgi:3-oxoacyl-[acyl-carrier protein] reductase